MSEPTRAYPRVRAAIAAARWAIVPEKLAEIVELIDFRADGYRYSEEEIAARVGAAQSRQRYAVSGSVAVIPVSGTIVPRGSWMDDSSGVTRVSTIRQAFRAALADSSVGSILLDVDSPGGVVDGVPELAAEIRSARGAKLIVAHANGLAASAAYWIASAADELVVTPSGEVGSIGVFAVHYDESGALEMKGVKPTMISAGRYKVEGNPFEPLSDEARGHIQSVVDEIYEGFVADVAKGRGIGAREVKAQYGEGRTVLARAALRAGMVDRIETIDETIARMSGARRSQRARRAEVVDLPAIEPVDSGRAASTDRRRRELWLMGAGRARTRHG